MPAKNNDLHKEILAQRNLGLSNPEIAKKLNVSKARIACILQKHYGGNSNYRKRITKHRHLHKEALIAYQNNNFNEAAKELNLTLSEMKSCLSLAYKDPKLKHIRKDSRRKDKWTSEQLIKMLQMIGLRPRNAIAKKIKRDNERVVKEKLQHLGLKYPKYLNGLTLSRYREIFGVEPQFYIQTDAGPGNGPGDHIATFFKIVPWVYIQDQIMSGELRPPQIIKQWIKIMSDFQEWIHNGDAYGNILTIINGATK